jgi:hypothetical protein
MAEREFEFGKVLEIPEDQGEYFFSEEIRDLLASGDAIQGVPVSMVGADRIGLPSALALGTANLFDTSRREVVMPAACRRFYQIPGDTSTSNRNLAHASRNISTTNYAFWYC